MVISRKKGPKRIFPFGAANLYAFFLTELPLLKGKTGLGPFPSELGLEESAFPNSVWLTLLMGPFVGPATWVLSQPSKAI